MGAEGVGGGGGRVFLLYLVSHTHLGCSTALDVKMNEWMDGHNCLILCHFILPIVGENPVTRSISFYYLYL